MGYDQYVYKPTEGNPKVWTRDCYGIETLSACMEEALDGFPHLTATIAISPAFERSKFEPQLREAWIALRHAVPVIAAKSGRRDDHFAFTYNVPDSVSDAEKWANETLFVSDDVKPVYDKHVELKDGRWWKPTDDHYVGELHASPTSDGWQLSVIFVHSSIDGRNGFAILDEFLGKLVAVIEGTAKPLSELKWGEETPRLSPATAIILHVEKVIDTAPKEAAAPVPAADSTDAAPPSPPIPWLWPPVETGNKGDISALVTLPTSTTSKLHQLCKQHSRTVTQVVTALSILAHAEVALQTAAKAGPERFKVVSGSYSQATFYLIAWNFINHRHKLPGGYSSFSSDTPSPLMTSDGVPLMLPMDPIRAFFKLDEEKTAVSTVSTQEAFWDSLVKATADGWKAHDTSLEAFWGREVVAQQSLHTFNPGLFHVPALITSSIGDLGRLNILEAYRPSKNNKTLTVHEAISGIRMRVPPLMNLMWQYDDRLSCQWFTAGEYTTKEELVTVTDAFKRWVKEYIA